jgi:signal transduction histidine kinase/ligand-binding sensor domain-containing protein
LKKYLFVLILAPLFSSSAQTYYFKKYTTYDGLVQGTIKAICQDSFGRMWFGTAEGISIYDGTEFHNYGTSERYPAPVVTCFYEPNPGTMLAGTIGGGILVFKKPPFKMDTVVAIIKDGDYILAPSISSIINGPDGRIWISSDKGLSIWQLGDGKIKKVIHKEHFGEFDTLSINQIAFKKDGTFYLATEVGLIEEKNDNYRRITSGLFKPDAPVFRVFCDSENRIWFSTLQGLYYLKDNNVFSFSNSHPEIDNIVIAFLETEDNSLLFGGYGKLFKYNSKSFEIIDESSGLTEKTIVCLFSDREKNLWIGSLEGTSKLTDHKLKFVYYDKPSTIYSKVKIINDKLIIGSNHGLFEVKNYSLVPTKLSDGIPEILIRDFVVQGDTIWCATPEGIYFKFKNKIGHLTTKDGLPHNVVYELNLDSEKRLWIATQAGVAYISKGKLYNFTNKIEHNWNYSDSESRNALSSISIRKIFPDKKGNVWVGSWDMGLIKIYEDSVFRFTPNDGITDLHIRGLNLDNDNNLWIGTRYSGAFKYDGYKFLQFSTKDGLNSNWVFSVIQDKYNNYWFTTANGISKYSNKHFSGISASEGISSSEVAIALEYKNEMWFNSHSQIIAYEINNATVEEIKPKIIFKEVRLLDGELPSSENPQGIERISSLNFSSPVEIHKSLKLDYSKNTILIDFAGLSFKDESLIKYDCILEGFDKNWTKSTKRNYVNYTHLPPGDYSFKVYAINGDGIKSDSPAVFSFTILPPFWQRWWFIVSTILATLFLTSIISILIYRSRMNQKIRVERLRTKISSDLHDEIGTSLSSIAIFSELIKRNSDNSSSKSKEMLEKIEYTSRNLIDKMSDIVWAINPQNDRLEDAILKLREYSVKLLESKGIDVRINIPEEVFNVTLTMDIRSNLLMIFKEIVTNAAKYSFAKTIDINFSISLQSGRKVLVLNVKDDGVGFNTSEVKSGNGLRNIIRRSKDINALLDFESSPGRGTNISLVINLE